MKKIKNVTVSYPKEYNDKLWAELFAKRDKLLRLSDFALLSDNGLTKPCLIKWKVWRKSLKLISREEFDTIQEATKELERIRNIIPEKEYEEGEMSDDEQEVLNQIAMDKMNKTIKTLENDVSSLASALLKLKERTKTKQPDNVEDYRKLLHGLAKRWYHKQFEDALEAPMPVILERCEQAIEYKINGDLSSLPLVRNYMKMTGRTADEICDKFINDKKELMQSITSLDRKMWNFKLTIDMCDDFQKFKSIQKQLTVD